MPKEHVKGVLDVQNMINQKSGYLEQYSIELHKGLQKLQEQFLVGINKAKTGKVSVVGSVQAIQNKLDQLDKRQDKIFGKFSKLHAAVLKIKGIDAVEADLKSIEGVVAGLLQNIESKGLTGLIDRGQELSEVFNEIIANEENIKALMNVRNLNIPSSSRSSWTTYVMPVFGLIVL